MGLMKTYLGLQYAIALFSSAGAASASLAAETIRFLPNDGRVEFKATGKPSALRVTGKGKG